MIQRTLFASVATALLIAAAPLAQAAELNPAAAPSLPAWAMSYGLPDATAGKVKPAAKVEKQAERCEPCSAGKAEPKLDLKSVVKPEAKPAAAEAQPAPRTEVRRTMTLTEVQI